MTDFTLLSLDIKRDPITYKKEFIDKLNYLVQLLELNNPPSKELKSLLLFVIKNTIRYKKTEINFNFNIVIKGLSHLTKHKDKVKILNEIVLLRKFNLITSKELFQLFITTGYNSNALEEYLEETVLDVLLEVYSSESNDKSKRIAYYYLMKYISKYNTTSHINELLLDPIVNNDRCNAKLFKYALYYFNDSLDIKLVENIITKDVQKLFYIRIIECKDENMLKIYLEIYLKTIKVVGIEYKETVTIIKKLLNVIDLNSILIYIYKLLQKLNTYSEVVEIIKVELLNYRKDEIIAQGLNLLGVIYKKTTDIKLKDNIEETIRLYAKSKIKCIEYSYKTVKRIIKNNKCVKDIISNNQSDKSSDEISHDSDIDFNTVFKVKQKITKEEKINKMKEGQIQSRKKLLEHKRNKHKKRNSKQKGKNKLFKKKKSTK